MSFETAKGKRNITEVQNGDRVVYRPTTDPLTAPYELQCCGCTNNIEAWTKHYMEVADTNLEDGETITERGYFHHSHEGQTIVFRRARVTPIA